MPRRSRTWSRFRASADDAARADALARAGASLVSEVPELRLAVVDLPADGATDIAAALEADPAVAHVERDRTRETEGAPNDPQYPDQWSLPRIGWDTVRDGPAPDGRAVVAVLDTGVDATHPDLTAHLLPGISSVDGVEPDTDPNGHGTWMAGIVAADTDNGEGIAGIAFRRVRVLPVTVLGADGKGFDSDIVEGIVAAVDAGADVILMSFSAPGYSAVLQAAVDYAWDHDVVVVGATGNDGSTAAAYPAGDRGVIGVTATDRDDRLAPGSNSGPAAFMAAPGVDILTTDVGGGYRSIGGTSAAAAEVAGAAGLLRAIDPDATNGVIVGRLARSAAPADTADDTGNGRLDLARAASDTGTDEIEPAGVGGPRTAVPSSGRTSRPPCARGRAPAATTTGARRPTGAGRPRSPATTSSSPPAPRGCPTPTTTPSGRRSTRSRSRGPATRSRATGSRWATGVLPRARPDRRTP